MLVLRSTTTSPLARSESLYHQQPGVRFVELPACPKQFRSGGDHFRAASEPVQPKSPKAIQAGRTAGVDRQSRVSTVGAHQHTSTPHHHPSGVELASVMFVSGDGSQGPAEASIASSIRTTRTMRVTQSVWPGLRSTFSPCTVRLSRAILPSLFSSQDAGSSQRRFRRRRPLRIPLREAGISARGSFPRMRTPATPSITYFPAYHSAGVILDTEMAIGRVGARECDKRWPPQL